MIFQINLNGLVIIVISTNYFDVAMVKLFWKFHFRLRKWLQLHLVDRIWIFCMWQRLQHRTNQNQLDVCSKSLDWMPKVIPVSKCSFDFYSRCITIYADTTIWNLVKIVYADIRSKQQQLKVYQIRNWSILLNMYVLFLFDSLSL